MDTHALLREGGPYIVSGLLMLSGLLLSFVRDLPRKAGAALSRVLIASVSISNDDPLFNIAQVWLDAHPYTRKIRNFTAKSALSDEDDDSLEQPTFLLTPAFGEHLFRHRGHLVWLERARDGASGKGRGRREPRERLTFRMFRGDRPALEALIDDMIAAHVARRRARMPVYVNLAYGWHTIGARAARSLDSLVLTEGVLETIVADIESFRASRDWYRSMGIPFRRGFLLHGPPGTGKSSLVGALAGRFEAPLYALSLTGNDFTDADLIELLHDVAPDAFVLLEDLDVAFNGREPGSKGVTMSGLLNAIDGAASKDGSVLFVSTNHVERLDPALRRPGRLDVQLELGYADFSQRRRLFERFFPRSTRGDTFAGRSSEVPLTIAELQEYLLEHRHDESLALGDVAEWARDRRQINGATSSPTHDESGCGRLVRKRIRERRPDTGFLSSRPQRSDVGVEEALWRTAYCSAGATGRDAERPSPVLRASTWSKKAAKPADLRSSYRAIDFISTALVLRKSSLPPDYRTREAVSAQLRALRTRLEVDGVRHVALFGSVARGDDLPESDVDVVLDLDPSKQIGLFQFAALAQVLEKALGCRVDVATRASLRPGQHDEILEDLHEVF